MNLAEQAKAKLNSARQVTLQKAWNDVCDKIEVRTLAMRPLPKVFEVHHMNEVARKAFLEAFVADKSDELCIGAALNSIGLE